MGRDQRSLTSSILERHPRVVVFHPDDDDGQTLTNHLRRMGFQVERCWPPLETLPDRTDLVFRALLPEERAEGRVVRAGCAARHLRGRV